MPYAPSANASTFNFKDDRMDQTHTLNDNPFAPPTQQLDAKTNFTETPEAYYFDASTGKRFANFVIDRVVAVIVTFLFGGALGLWAVFVANDPELESLSWLYIPGVEWVLEIAIYLAYLMTFEAFFGVTIGKLITGTRVVKFNEHQKPGFGTILIRNLCRLIPFEPFSFFGGTPRGWHDTISKTRVVDMRKAPLTGDESELLPDYMKNDL